MAVPASAPVAAAATPSRGGADDATASAKSSRAAPKETAAPIRCRPRVRSGATSRRKTMLATAVAPALAPKSRLKPDGVAPRSVW